MKTFRQLPPATPICSTIWLLYYLQCVFGKSRSMTLSVSPFPLVRMIQARVLTKATMNFYALHSHNTRITTIYHTSQSPKHIVHEASQRRVGRATWKHTNPCYPAANFRLTANSGCNRSPVRDWEHFAKGSVNFCKWVSSLKLVPVVWITGIYVYWHSRVTT